MQAQSGKKHRLDASCLFLVYDYHFTKGCMTILSGKLSEIIKDSAVYIEYAHTGRVMSPHIHISIA